MQHYKKLSFFFALRSKLQKVNGIAQNSQNNTAKVVLVLDDDEKDEVVGDILVTMLDEIDDLEEGIVDIVEELVFLAFHFVLVGTFRNFVVADMVKDCVGCYKDPKVPSVLCAFFSIDFLGFPQETWQIILQG